MAVFNEPSKWQTSLVNSGDANTIPQNTPAGTGEASFEEGFPQITQVPIGAGGQAPDRKDFNGLFKVLGDWIFYAQNGGIASYSNKFDYAVGSFVKYNDEFYRCVQANGTSTTVKAPTDTAYWSKITTLADVANAFANQDLSNLSASGQAIIDNKANISFSNVNNIANILMAHNAMPSTKYDDLTLGASEITYTAPADGFFFLSKVATAVDQIVTLENQSARFLSMIGVSYANNVAVRAWIPVKKGDTVYCRYTAGGNIQNFVFIYAVGSESEQGA